MEVKRFDNPTAAGASGMPQLEFGELKRRYASTRAASRPTPPKTAGCSRGLADPTQAYVLLNMASPGGRPRAPRVAVRILGFFETHDSALAAAKELEAADPACAIACVKTLEWYLMAHKTKAPEVIKNKMDRLLALHAAARVASRREFQAHRDALRGERKPTFSNESPNLAGDEKDVVIPDKLLEDAEAAAAADAAVPAAAAPPVAVRDVPLSLQQSNRHAVVCVVDDADDGGAEPGLAILAGFATDLDARAYVEHVATKAISDFDVCVVDMFKWVALEDHASDVIDQVERDSELNLLMAKNRARQTEVHNFKSMCEKLDMAVPVREIEPDVREDGSLTSDARLLTNEDVPVTTSMRMTAVEIAAAAAAESKSGTTGAAESKSGGAAESKSGGAAESKSGRESSGGAAESKS